MFKFLDFLFNRKQFELRIREDERAMIERFMVETLQMTLNSKNLLGKGAFGYTRLQKVCALWKEVRSYYYPALENVHSSCPYQADMDEKLQVIADGHEEIVPFRERYWS